MIRKVVSALLFALVSASATAITNDQVFAYAAANYPGLFAGNAVAGRYAQYDYRYYPASQNYLAVDTSGTIFLLGPATGGALVSVGAAAAFADTILAWEARQGGGTLLGGTIQGRSLNLSAAVTTLAGSAGTTLATPSDGTGANATFYRAYGVATDGTNLYVADTGYNVIRKVVIASGAVSTLAGPPLNVTGARTGTVDGVGPAVRFTFPRGITTDGTNLYVADTGSSTIRKVVIATGAVTTLVRGLGAPGITTDGVNLYVTSNHAVSKIEIATGTVTTIAGVAGLTKGSTDGVGAAARFNEPAGITTDGVNLYVADNLNATIRKVVIATGAVTTIAGTAGARGTADGTGAAAQFAGPYAITTDGTNLYVGDNVNANVRKIVLATGAVSTLAGATTGWPGPLAWASTAPVDGTGTNAVFTGPNGLASDGVSLFATDNWNTSTTIRRIR